MTHAVEPRAFLVVGFDHHTGCVGGVGVEEHRVLRFRVSRPLVERLRIDGRELQVFQRIVAPGLESTQWFLATYQKVHNTR
jgi:hypothetical protein